MDSYILPGSQIIVENKFEELKIDNRLKECLRNMGMVDMTAIQTASIPHLLEGKDLLGAAKTGSGKTLAFLVPLVERVLRAGVADDTVALVLSPTRELSLQTFGILEGLIACTTITAGLLIGGNNIKEEEVRIRRGLTIIVATPGRMLDHLNNTKPFDYSRLHTLVIDEADRLMDQGFLEEVKAIIKRLPKERQTVLFSATLNINSVKLKKKRKTLNESNDVIVKKKKMSTEDKVLSLACFSLKQCCICVDINKIDKLTASFKNKSNTTTVEQLNQRYIICEAEERFRVLYTLIQKNQNKKVMIFMSTCLEVEFYYKLLRHIYGTDSKYSSVIALHKKQEQVKREKSFTKFREEEDIIMLCTDVASRGLDIPKVDLVIQYGPPDNLDEYIHRVGRTARAGKSGEAIIILRSHERDFLSMLVDASAPITSLELHSGDMVPIQPYLEKLVASIQVLQTMAEDAYKSVITAYSNSSIKCFDINDLDFLALGRNFGLPKPPHYNLTDSQKNRSRKRVMSAEVPTRRKVSKKLKKA